MIPFHSTATASSQFLCVLNCQLFTQVITVAVILCKYSRCSNNCITFQSFSVCLNILCVNLAKNIHFFLCAGFIDALLGQSPLNLLVHLCYLGVSIKQLECKTSKVQQKYITVLQSR